MKNTVSLDRPPCFFLSSDVGVFCTYAPTGTFMPTGTPKLLVAGAASRRHDLVAGAASRRHDLVAGTASGRQYLIPGTASHGHNLVAGSAGGAGQIHGCLLVPCC